MSANCPLCGRDKHMRKPKQLYGHAVCKKCVNAFANRRQIAFVVDVLLVRVIVFGATFAIGLGIGTLLAAQGREVDEATLGMLTFVDLAFTGVGMALLASRDAMGGVSPGKAITGVRVVHQDTNLPIGFATSLKRNWPVLIPIMPLVMAVQLLKGPRAGDGLAGTRVVWSKYAHLPVFQGLPEAASPVAAAAPNVPPPPSASQNPYDAPRY